MLVAVSARISPDMHWLSYQSNESGKYEIYISTFPQFGSKWQVSTGGGTRAIWDQSGKAIYYVSPENKMMEVPFTFSGNSVKPGAAREMFPIRFAGGFSDFYDVTRDGKIIAVTNNETVSAGPISFTVNWTQAIKK